MARPVAIGEFHRELAKTKLNLPHFCQFYKDSCRNLVTVSVTNLAILIYVYFLPELKSLWRKKKNVIVKNNIAIRIAGKVSRYIDASMNRTTPRLA